MIQGLVAALLFMLHNLSMPPMTDVDHRFLNALDSHGVGYVSADWAIWDAHRVCADLGRGVSPESEAEAIMGQTDLDGWHAGFYVGASIGAYCPQWIG
jgi:hypothetical protein